MYADRVKEIIGEQLGVKLSEVKDHVRLVDDLGVDELDLIELTMALEEGMEPDGISDSDSLKWVTVGDVVRFMEDKK